MSTKLFNGYRLPGDTNLARLSRDLGERTDPVYRKLALGAVTVTAALLAADPVEKAETEQESKDPVATTCDMVSRNQVTADDLRRTHSFSLLGQAAAIVDAVQVKLDSEFALRVPAVFDLVFEVSFHHDPDDDRWIYARLFTDRAEFQQIWEQTAGVEPWPYWDNSDPMEGVSADEWGERGSAWARATDNHGSHRAMLSWERGGADLAFEAMLGLRPESQDWLTAEAAVSWIAEQGAKPDFESRRAALRDRFNGPPLGLKPRSTPS